MKSITVYGSIRSGKLSISHRDRFVKSLANWTDCRVVVKIEKVYRKRSSPQNAYLHGYIIPSIRDGLIDAGYTPSDVTDEKVKSFLKERFLKYSIYNETTGEYIDFIRPTSECTTTQLMEFFDEVIRWASEYLNIKLYYPDEQTELFEENVAF